MLPITLPQELIDLIVDEVASDRSERVDTLKTCSLVSKSFSQPARTRIFSNITIEYNIIYERRGTKKFDRVEALWNTLQRDPRLARKVCAFELNLVEVIRFPRLIGTDYWDWDLSKERIDQVVLPGIMDTLAEAQRGHTGYRGRLHTLGLGGYDLFLLDWNRLPSKFQQSWWALCAASTLKYLRVGRMRDFPLTLDIGMKPLLRRLELVVELPSSSTTMTLPYAQLASGEGFASLEELECVHLLGWWPPDDICTIIAMTCASTLRTLKM
ncbi:hypothetical protein BDN70DRAFT_328662 [Pholiota conissans]|uniref:F-box domain-containing protein n=1 Tax=Pholiota conissans TaxID=109636 RepID=A0A9P6CWU2_9AGAR|nr:hypothetical protein BDN70DRAFT_328662 [Pholiota conissans]